MIDDQIPFDGDARFFTSEHADEFARRNEHSGRTAVLQGFIMMSTERIRKAVSKPSLLSFLISRKLSF